MTDREERQPQQQPERHEPPRRSQHGSDEREEERLHDEDEVSVEVAAVRLRVEVEAEPEPPQDPRGVPDDDGEREHRERRASSRAVGEHVDDEERREGQRESVIALAEKPQEEDPDRARGGADAESDEERPRHGRERGAEVHPAEDELRDGGRADHAEDVGDRGLEIQGVRDLPLDARDRHRGHDHHRAGAAQDHAQEHGVEGRPGLGDPADHGRALGERGDRDRGERETDQGHPRRGRRRPSERLDPQFPAAVEEDDDQGEGGEEGSDLPEHIVADEPRDGARDDAGQHEPHRVGNVAPPEHHFARHADEEDPGDRQEKDRD